MAYNKLQDKQIYIDKKEHFIDNLDEILGILLSMVSEK